MSPWKMWNGRSQLKSLGMQLCAEFGTDYTLEVEERAGYCMDRVPGGQRWTAYLYRHSRTVNNHQAAHRRKSEKGNAMNDQQPGSFPYYQGRPSQSHPQQQQQLSMPPQQPGSQSQPQARSYYQPYDTQQNNQMYYQVQQYQPMYPGSVPQHQFQQYAMGYQQQPQVAATQQPQAAQQQSQQSQQPQSQQQQPPQYYPYQDYKPMNLPVRPIQAPPEASPVQRPKLTTTFWEDEGTVCYQVEARGISVSRREDTNFINGTKLLNVAGMTRGRRDGILKSEKVRYVVKIGAMNLKGVWIPFERALELARNEGIVDLLYPLFVKDIKELYQGPQYSGGLTAQANSNPKNIIPVTVTTSGYTPGAYASKKQPETPTTAQTTSSAPPNTSTTATTISDLAPQPHGHRQTSSSGPQEFPYGYGYQDHYQYPKGYYNYQPEEKEDK